MQRLDLHSLFSRLEAIATTIGFWTEEKPWGAVAAFGPKGRGETPLFFSLPITSQNGWYQDTLRGVY